MPGAAEALHLPAPALGPEGGEVAEASSNLQNLSIVPSTAPPESSAGSTALKGRQDGKSKPAPVVVATHTKSIGIIHPPPDIRSIVDKTATFVARNGPEFEKKILAANKGNAKFNFLNPTDPYHAYYRFKISETASQLGLPVSAPIAAPAPPPPSATSTAAAQDKAGPSTTAGILTEGADEKAGDGVVKGPKPPEPELYTVRVPEGLSGLDLDVIKLTAQFVARNGKTFLTGLISREHMNPQFHFLKPTHSLFTFFTALADAYSRVLNPPKPVLAKTKEHADGGYTAALGTCLARLDWERSQERARKQAEDEVEQERIQMALIDWHDFVVVETIEFEAGEEASLPLPISQEELIRKSKQLGMEEDLQAEAEAASAAAGGEGRKAGVPMDDEERKLVEEGMQEGEGGEKGEPPGPPADDGPAPPPPPEEDEDEEMDMEDDDAPMKIVKDWKRPEERAKPAVDPTKVVVSPITGELIAISEMAEHMRISLIDPKYKEQKERMMAKLRENTLANDDEITRNIVGLARTRPDIFGTTEEEVSNAVRQELEKKKEEPSRVMWDGHSASIGRTTTQALQQSLTPVPVPQPPVDSRPTAGPAAPPPSLPKPPLRPLPPPPVRPSVPVMNSLTPPGVTVPMMNPVTGRAVSQTTLSMAPPRPPMQAPQPPFGLRPPGVSQMAPLAPPGVSAGPPGVPGMHAFAPPGAMGMRPPGMPMGAPTMGPPGVPHAALGAAGVLGVPGMLPVSMASAGGAPGDDERDAKRARVEEPQLIPESAFLAQHPGPVRISITLPSVDGEASLNGQMIEVTVSSLAETTGALKELIAKEVGLPANKQKLNGKAGFFKDSLTLAHYNVGPGDTVSLSLKERGGRKK